MAAEKGNNYAEKWTREATIEKLQEISLWAADETCLWLGSAMVKVGLYRTIWPYWKEKFADDEEVFDAIKRIEQAFEDRLFIMALKGHLNPTVAIFGLKNNHDWKDKKEFEGSVGVIDWTQ